MDAELTPYGGRRMLNWHVGFRGCQLIVQFFFQIMFTVPKQQQQKKIVVCRPTKLQRFDRNFPTEV